MTPKYATREDWLHALREQCVPLFETANYPLPDKIRLSCGFPRSQRKATGQCWSAESSEDGTYEIFVSPVLSDAVEVAATIVHELCHAAVGIEAGHKGTFRECATTIGLEGKMTATTAGAKLTTLLKEITGKLGPYPHAILNPSATVKKQGTRMIKVECPECGYAVRTTRKWLDVGLPVCPCGEEMREVA